MTVNAPSQPDIFRENIERIESALRRYAVFGAGCPARLREAIEYSLLAPGKRLRPQLVLLASQACGGEIEKALPAAAAVEMVHAYSLVHDDLPAMDDDDLRRGRPTCHKQFDEATAILVGDALLAKAFEVLATKIEPAELAARCCGELAQAAGATALVGGQAEDLASQREPQLRNQSTIERLESIHRRKTGALFRVSLRLGGLIAGGTPQELVALDEYAQHLGLAFQVVDDLLDVSGSEGAMGKRTGKDREQGKTTYPGLMGVEASRARAKELIDKASEALDCFGEAGDPLRSLALFVRRRNT